MDREALGPRGAGQALGGRERAGGLGSSSEQEARTRGCSHVEHLTEDAALGGLSPAVTGTDTEGVQAKLSPDGIPTTSFLTLHLYPRSYLM